jgi:hypothetical protein
VSLLSGCNLGLQPRGVDSGSSSGADNTANAGANTWLEWPKSSTLQDQETATTTRQGRCYRMGGIFVPCEGYGPSGSSGLVKDPVSGEKVVADVGPGLDEYTWDTINIDVPIRRYVGDIDRAVLAGTLSANAILKLAVYDVDSTEPCPEVDELFLNGHKLDNLTGQDDKWTLFQQGGISVKYLNFPTTPGKTAHNTITIKVNTKGCKENYATTVDWAKISFEAGPVVVLVHGINPTGHDWDSFHARLTSKGIVSDKSILLPYADFDKQGMRDPIMCDTPRYTSVTTNATQIINNLKRIATEYGTGNLTLVGHSKGGMDSKAAIFTIQNTPPSIVVGSTGATPVKEPLTIQSLVTINTPHLGTPAGDLGIELTLEQNHLIKEDEFDRLLGNPADFFQSFMQAQITSKLLGKNHVCDLTVARATKINSDYPIDFLHTFGTITDIAASPPNITSFDTEDLGDGNSQRGLDVWQRLYKFVGTTQYLTLDPIIDPITGRSLFSVIRVPKPPNVFETNDVLVTRTSARGSGIPLVIDGQPGIHHIEVINDLYVQALLPRLALQDPSGTHGVNWRKQ